MGGNFRHGLWFAASRGAFTRIGGDFSSIGVSYSYNWMGNPPTNQRFDRLNR